MTGDEWIVIPNWEKFQHYKDRNPPWIRVYTELNSRDSWTKLTRSGRGLLATVWLEYARSGGSLRARTVLALCDSGARYAHLEALNRAGFIGFSASEPPRLEASVRARASETETETETETELPLTPPPEGIRIECKKCGETIKPGAICWNCGASPRAAGSNPRAVSEHARDELHAEVLARAWQIAASWNGSRSDTFDDQLDDLERELGARLTASERLRIWDAALTGL